MAHFVGVLRQEQELNLTAVTTTQTEAANATKALINQLIFAESKSVRTSTIILAAFNVAAALLTVTAILYDCYWAAKRASVNNKPRKFCVSDIHPAETFPLVLGLGIAIQGIVFAAVQATGLQSIYIDGCGIWSQLVFPAIFLVPFVQLVFGLECVLRSFRTLPFQARGQFDVSICSAVVMLMVAGTWIPTHLNPEEDVCFASLMWFITKYGVEGLVILAATAGLSTLSAIVIFYRLSTGSMIDQHQRIAASRMVYYLVLAVIPLAFVIPWFITLTLDEPNLTASMMATVVLNLSGILNGALYIFLRSNTVAASFCPKDFTQWTKNQHEIRLWGPNELGFTDHLLIPVTGPGFDSRMNYNLEKVLSDESLISMFSPDPRDRIIIESPTPRSDKEVVVITTVDEPVARTPSKKLHAKNPSYSLFPAEGLTSPNVPASSRITSTQTQSTMTGAESESHRIITDLATSPDEFARPFSNRHSRNMSAGSTTTVQIGMRFSGVVPAGVASFMPSQYEVPALLSTTYQAPTTSARTADRLQIRTQNLSPQLPLRSPYRPSPLQNTSRSISGSPTSAALTPLEARMKTLPPVPHRQSRIERLSVEDDTQITLSPTVYNRNPAIYTPTGRSSPSHTPSISSSSVSSHSRNATISRMNSPRRPAGMMRGPSSTSDGLTRNSNGEWI